MEINMTDKEKAKAYDEAIETAKKYHTPDSNNTNLKAVLEHIFPVLTESDEEKIRKQIVLLMEERLVNTKAINGISSESIFAYLEKQKEQNPIPKFKVGDRIYDKRDSYNRNIIREVGKDYYINAFAQKMDMAYTDANFEFLEHLDDDIIPNKPTEWSEDIIRKAVKEVGLTQHQIDWFKTNVFPPKPEWSEEDEQVISAMIRDFESEIAVWEHKEGESGKSAQKHINTYKGFISFIKSFRPQPKREWSEEDEHTIQWAYDVIRRIGEGTDPQINRECAKELAVRLKSLPERFNLQPAEWSEEDESITKSLIDLVNWAKINIIAPIEVSDADKALAWLEKQKEPEWCHHKVDLSDCSEEYRKAYYDGWNNCNQQHSQLQAEQKPAEWSEEDEWKRNELLKYLEEKGDYRSTWYSWLKSLRPQPKGEIYKSAKRDLAIRFMNYLDENRPDGKMSLSNGECEDIDKAFKENDWAKIIRYVEKYSPSWKPSEEQMEWLESAVKLSTDKPHIHGIIVSLYEQLKKL